MSTEYSFRERLLARALSSTPRLKAVIKGGYQRLVYLRNRRAESWTSLHNVLAQSEGDSQSFFGYYDKCPLNPSGTHIIFQETSDCTKGSPRCRGPVKVVLVRECDGRVINRFSSGAYNWQQGTKLQWITDNRFVFNAYDWESDAYVARICDAVSGETIRTLPAPVYDCFGDRFSLTLNFDRLARLASDYGYFCRMNRPFDVDSVHDDGVWWMDITTGEARLILSLAQLEKLAPLKSMVGAKHSVNHIMIAPDGERFMVIHRWYKGRRRYDRLVLAGVDGRNPTVLADEGMVSHCFWATGTEVLGYLRGPDGSEGYWLLDTVSREVRQLDCSGLEGLGDGHPHVVGDWFVTDTYPDKARMQHLMLGNWRTGEVRELGQFFHGFEYEGESRCDLHPRLTPDGKGVYFDSVFSGKRRLYRLDL